MKKRLVLVVGLVSVAMMLAFAGMGFTDDAAAPAAPAPLAAHSVAPAK